MTSSGQTIDASSRDAQRLQDFFRPLHRVVVAFSGGVDSSVVAAAAYAALADRAIAVTADSPSVPRWQLALAADVAKKIAIPHQVMATHEIDRPQYQRNHVDRCYFCKQTLYDTLAYHFRNESNTSIVSGTNADDLQDYRPGIHAGDQRKVLTPLAALSMGKTQVRELARRYGLPNHDLPASPCLSSRIAYGVPVTKERLERVERAEDWLRSRGFTVLRVRLHAGELARIEVPSEQIPKLLACYREHGLHDVFRTLGFQYVTVDMEGFQSGKLNRDLVTLSVPSGSTCTTIQPGRDLIDGDQSDRPTPNAESNACRSSEVVH